ncbi:MAG: DUF2782 domain-containing protein [Arenicellales bacterium]|nr:DUF2782 domain-containing protein [Arenicellales bacterium]
MRQLIMSTVLVAVWAIALAQDPVEIPNPPAIPTEEERIRAEQAAKQYATENDQGEEDLGGVQTREFVVGNNTITEFSRGGHVFMLKVKPKNAPAQYIDESMPGGNLTPSDPGISENTQTNLPKWRLGSF